MPEFGQEECDEAIPFSVECKPAHPFLAELVRHTLAQTGKRYDLFDKVWRPRFREELMQSTRIRPGRGAFILNLPPCVVYDDYPLYFGIEIRHGFVGEGKSRYEFFELPIGWGTPVAVYLASPQEIDLSPFIRKMLAMGVKVVAPRWNGETYELAVLKGLDEAHFRQGPMGIANRSAMTRGAVSP